LAGNISRDIAFLDENIGTPCVNFNRKLARQHRSIQSGVRPLRREQRATHRPYVQRRRSDDWLVGIRGR
jgi:hypothetical protein